MNELWGDRLAPEGDPAQDHYLDPGVYEIVWGLYEAGVKTTSSCQGGGPPHAFMEMLVRVGFNDEAAGPRAAEVAQRLGMPILWLHRVQCVGEDLFWWELRFDRHAPPWKRPAAVEAQP